MTDLAKVVANHSVNTCVSRVRRPFEMNRSVLKRTVRWEEWLADAEADLAQKLGGKVVLMGHSTGALPSELLDVARDVQRAHVDNRGDADALAPGQEFPRRLGVGAARVLVADVGGEEFAESRICAGPAAATRAASCSSVMGASWLMAN